jgi:hypothetical protein
MSTTLGSTIYSVARQAPQPPGPGQEDSGPAAILVSYDVRSRASRTVPILLPPGDTLPPQQWTAIVAIPAWSPAAAASAGRLPPTAVPRQPLALLGLRAQGDGTFTYQASAGVGAV